MTIVDAAYLEIVGRTSTVQLATYDIFLANTWMLRGTGAARGGDRLIPGGSGVRPYPRRSTITQYTLPLRIRGDVNANNVPESDPCAAVIAKLEGLISNLFVGAVANTVANVLACTLHHPTSGAARTGSIRVVDIAPKTAMLGAAIWDCDFVCELPFGRLT